MTSMMLDSRMNMAKKRSTKSRGDYIRVTDFKVVDFEVDNGADAEPRHRHVVILYAKGEDGIVYEFVNSKWVGIPILLDHAVTSKEQSGGSPNAQRFPDNGTLESADSGGATTNPKAPR